ncbi:methyltransferase domain-containing protein [Candidatus Parcubacteria bacterium]|nr:methyltransferase domain-containing protein [Candidatus Parcubacteria bacterium]
MIIEFLQKNDFCRKVVCRLGEQRAKDLLKEIYRHLDKKESIIDIGAGTCNVCAILTEKQFKVTPLDVKNLSFVDGVEPIIYKTGKIPFRDNSFNVSLILTVLHHTPIPEDIIKEAQRVSKKIIIIEDIYVNIFHKYLTFFADSLLNFEFVGHPHTNKSDKEWKMLFKKLGLQLKGARYRKSFLVFKQAVYYLES